MVKSFNFTLHILIRFNTNGHGWLVFVLYVVILHCFCIDCVKVLWSYEYILVREWWDIDIYWTGSKRCFNSCKITSDCTGYIQTQLYWFSFCQIKFLHLIVSPNWYWNVWSALFIGCDRKLIKLKSLLPWTNNYWHSNVNLIKIDVKLFSVFVWTLCFEGNIQMSNQLDHQTPVCFPQN